MNVKLKKRAFFVLCALLFLLCACAVAEPSESIDSGASLDTVSDVYQDTETTAKPDDTTSISTDENTCISTEKVPDTSDGIGSADDTQSSPADSCDTTEIPDTENDPPETKLPDAAQLVMVGDILMHDPVLAGGKNGDGYSFDHLFSNVQSKVSAADIALFNQEVIIAGDKYPIKGYPRFNAPFELADALAAAGFDVALHATNHTLDLGRGAMLECLDYWETAHPEIEVVGMHDSEEDAARISVIEKNGIKTAILNYTYGLNPAGSDDIDAYPYLVDVLGETRVRADVARAKELSDLVVVAVHWGSEYSSSPSKSQRRWAQLFLECGVDLVLGTHPHVLQPIEWIEGDDGHRMLVYWSLGNFVNCTGESGAGKGERMLGAMASVSLERNEDGKVYIKHAEALPLITHISYEKFGITTYFFDNYTEEMFSENKVTDIDSTLSYDSCERKFEEMLGEFWVR